MRILGIDPGIAIVGFGLIEADRGRTRLLNYGAITTPAGLPLARRLVQIEQDMEALIAQLKPDAIAVEELFFSNNITTGIAVALPGGTFGGVFARSGLASREGLRPANCVGVVDSDYRGECLIALHNDTEEPRTVRTGERIAQLILLPYLPIEFDEVTDLPETARGEGGFGSTGR